MMKRSLPVLFASACATLALLTGTSLQAGALEDYVRNADSSFKWSVRENKVMDGLDVATLDLTSQTWHGGVWTHTLYIARPHELRNPSIALLEITAGVGEDALPTVKLLAERSGALVAIVTSVPNQPLFGNKQEDGLIAYTFDQYLKTGDETWPLLLPMTKSATRAMDAVQAWALAERQQKIERFVVSGVSKRGWTTWLTGAVDKRVCGIAPIVIDMLNMKAQTQWAQRVYGRQSEKINDYTDLGLVEKMDLPEMAKLRGIVDPYSYRLPHHAQAAPARHQRPLLDRRRPAPLLGRPARAQAGVPVAQRRARRGRHARSRPNPGRLPADDGRPPDAAATDVADEGRRRRIHHGQL